MLPLFYHDSFEISLEATRTMIHAGIKVLEYTNRGERSLDNFIRLKDAIKTEFPDFILGIGTVKTIDEALEFTEAGADFIVSPIVDAEVGKYVADKGLLWIPGAMTPSEIAMAQKTSRSTIIKIFPANIVGRGFIEAVKDIFPGQLFMPTGGVDLTFENISAWFNAGVCAVGLGSKLISKKILQNGDYKSLYENTKLGLTLIERARP